MYDCINAIHVFTYRTKYPSIYSHLRSKRPSRSSKIRDAFIYFLQKKKHEGVKKFAASSLVEWDLHLLLSSKQPCRLQLLRRQISGSREKNEFVHLIQNHKLRKILHCFINNCIINRQIACHYI